jgi:two-component system LytT family sensor kinase
MRNRNVAYWLCQIGGWFSYGITMLFVLFVFDQKVPDFYYSRIVISIALGFFFTHILRELLMLAKLQPLTFKRKWVSLFIIVFAVCAVYSLSNSAIVEWLKLYDQSKKVAFQFQKRAFGNFIWDSPIIVIWVLIYFVWHYIQSARQQEIDKVKLESLVKELELKTIKSHINPHFIFNALNSIRALVDENPERARTAITELSNLLRSSMHAEKLELTSLEKELNIVKDYLALEYIRFEDRLQVEYDIDEDTLDQDVPPMMLQTLVENAIKHGISRQVNGGVIKIISDFKDDHHELIVRNSGRLSDKTNNDGFGVASTRNRLKLLYGDKAYLELKDLSENTVEAKVVLPITTL